MMVIYMMFDNNNFDNGPCPYVIPVQKAAIQNNCFRKAVWTGKYLQMTLMSLRPCEEIGIEMHKTVDQMIRVEQGEAIIKMGTCRCSLNNTYKLCTGDAVFIPACTWHNVINTGRSCLKLSSIYAPPNHPRGTVHETKADAEKAHY